MGALAARDGAEGGAQLDRVRAGAEAGETDDHVLQPTGERRLVRPRLHREAPLPVRAPGNLRRAVRARMAVRDLQHDSERLLRHLEQLGAVVLRTVVHVAREKRLEEAEPALRGHRAARREFRVGLVALARAIPARLVVDAGVELLARADRPRADGPVDRRRVLVEDLADLLARERLEAALVELRVHGPVRREAELLADAAQRVVANAALLERLHERLLDRDHLGVRDGRLVLPPPPDEVVDFLDLGLAREPDLPGVERAVRDALELVDCQVDV